MHGSIKSYGVLEFFLFWAGTQLLGSFFLKKDCRESNRCCQKIVKSSFSHIWPSPFNPWMHSLERKKFHFNFKIAPLIFYWHLTLKNITQLVPKCCKIDYAKPCNPSTCDTANVADTKWIWRPKVDETEISKYLVESNRQHF